MPEETASQLTESQPEGLLGSETLVATALKEAQKYFDLFESQRQEYREIWKVNDYMYRCAQNRSLNTDEKSKGANLGNDTERANTGSTLFFRQVNQISALFVSILRSKDVPFKYRPINNEGNMMSTQDAEMQAHQLDCIAKWTMKKDGFSNKVITFANQLTKYGNIPVLIEWINRKAQRTFRIPNIVARMTEAGVVPAQDGWKEETKEVTTDNYPSLRILPVDSIWTDVLMGDLESQDCIIVCSLHAKHFFYNGGYNQEQVKKIDKKHVWDGSTRKDLLQDRLESEKIDTVPSIASDQFLTYDILMRCPIKENEWKNEEAARDIYWITVVGNSIKDGLTIKFDANYDPDKEFPIKMIHDLPDDEDLLYHMSRGQVVRSNYSVECTLKNQAIDNCTLVNSPPLKEIEGAVRGTDRTFGPGVTFTMDSLGSLEEFEIRDTTLQTVNMLNYIRDDTMTALSTDKLMMGEAAGARTSAYEISKLDRNSSAPHMVAIQYSLDQFLRFYARKLRSYWNRYADPDQVLSITDEYWSPQVNPKNINGEFDIEIDIVDEFEDDMMERQTINDALTLIAQNPLLAQVHDIPALMSAWWKKRGFDPTEFVKAATNVDSQEIASQENILMMQSATPAQVRPGEDKNTHLGIHKKERMRYKGVEQEYPNIVLLDQHISETEMAIQQEQAIQSAPIPGGATPQNAGAAGGNEIAGALGGMMGGGMGGGNMSGGTI